MAPIDFTYNGPKYCSAVLYYVCVHFIEGL